MKAPKSICLVDDSADYRFVLKHLFTQLCPNHQTRVFSSGQDLLDQLPSLNPAPSLILLDLHMPHLNGHQLLLHLRANSCTHVTPIVMLSAEASPEEIVACYKAGANSFVNKSISTDGHKEALSLICKYWFDVNMQPTI